MSKVQKLDNTAADPADRIAKSHDAGCVCYEMCDNIQIDLTEANEGGKHDNHRPAGISPTAQCSGQHVVDAVKQKKCHIGADEEHAIRNDCGIRREKPDCAGSEK